MNDETIKVIEAIAGDVLTLAHLILDDESISSNKKTGRNSLRNTLLSKDVRVEIHHIDQSVVIETIFNDYIDYIEHGRKPRSGKQPPIDALRDWALSRGISTDNSTLFLISRAIWRDGYETPHIGDVGGGDRKKV